MAAAFASCNVACRWCDVPKVWLYLLRSHNMTWKLLRHRYVRRTSLLLQNKGYIDRFLKLFSAHRYRIQAARVTNLEPSQQRLAAPSKIFSFASRSPGVLWVRRTTPAIALLRMYVRVPSRMLRTYYELKCLKATKLAWKCAGTIYIALNKLMLASITESWHTVAVNIINRSPQTTSPATGVPYADRWHKDLFWSET